MIGMLLNVVHLQVHKKRERHPLLRGEGWGGRKRKRAGHDGKGSFPSSHRPPHAFYFSVLIAIFIWKPTRSLSGGESERHVTIRDHSTLLTMIEVQGYKHASFKS